MSSAAIHRGHRPGDQLWLGSLDTWMSTSPATSRSFASMSSGVILLFGAVRVTAITHPPSASRLRFDAGPFLIRQADEHRDDGRRSRCDQVGSPRPVPPESGPCLGLECPQKTEEKQQRSS